jgi:hypothetical protein
MIRIRKRTRKRIGAITAAICTVLGGIAAGIAIWQFIQPGGTSSSPMLREQSMVSRLIAGDQYTRLREIIGVEPDLQKNLKSGRILYQFNRPWEYIDLLVSGGSVLSVGVYAKETDFKPTLHAGGYAVTVNGPPIVRQTRYASGVGAAGECGGSSGATFFEGFSLPMANQVASFVLGWVNLRSLDIPPAACAAVDFSSYPLKGCIKLDQVNGLSSKFLSCLNSSRTGQQIARLSPSVVVVTAAGQRILPDMIDIAPLL